MVATCIHGYVGYYGYVHVHVLVLCGYEVSMCKCFSVAMFCYWVQLMWTRNLCCLANNFQYFVFVGVSFKIFILC